MDSYINSGAGFPAGTLVNTDKGLIQIHEIKAGDMVLSSPEQGNGVFQVNNMRNHRFIRAVAGPAIALRIHQRRRGEVRHDPDGGGNIAGHLQVQHFLDEHAEHQVEGFFRGGFRLGRGRSTRPLAALVVSNILAVDLVSALNRVHGAHVQRNGEQLHANRCLGNGGSSGGVGGKVRGIALGNQRRNGGFQVQQR